MLSDDEKKYYKKYICNAKRRYKVLFNLNTLFKYAFSFSLGLIIWAKFCWPIGVVFGLLLSSYYPYDVSMLNILGRLFRLYPADINGYGVNPIFVKDGYVFFISNWTCVKSMGFFKKSSINAVGGISFGVDDNVAESMNSFLFKDSDSILVVRESDIDSIIVTDEGVEFCVI